MGPSCASAEMIIQEHLYRPITGKVLLIGRQNTDITPQAYQGPAAEIGIVRDIRGGNRLAKIATIDSYRRCSGMPPRPR
jgi:hypothetical protein